MADALPGAAAPIPAAVRAAHPTPTHQTAAELSPDAPVGAAVVVLPPLQLLRQFDGWLQNTGHDDCHPWRLSILATLARHGGDTSTHPTYAELQREVLHRTGRMLALVDLARALPLGDTPLPADGDSTDRDMQLSALLHCLTTELQDLNLMAARTEGGAA